LQLPDGGELRTLDDARAFLIRLPSSESNAPRLRIPVKATMHSGAWRPLDPVDDDQGGA
jgi:hypothetical protein